MKLALWAITLIQFVFAEPCPPHEPFATLTEQAETTLSTLEPLLSCDPELLNQDLKLMESVSRDSLKNDFSWEGRINLPTLDAYLIKLNDLRACEAAKEIALTPCGPKDPFHLRHAIDGLDEGTGFDLIFEETIAGAIAGEGPASCVFSMDTTMARAPGPRTIPLGSLTECPESSGKVESAPNALEETQFSIRRAPMYHEMETKNCRVFVSANPNQAEAGKAWRTFYFDAKGDFTITGLGNQWDGARQFMVFPRRYEPTVTVMPNSEIWVRVTNGEVIRFSPNGEVIDTGRMEFTQVSEVTPQNQTGFSLKFNPGGIILDAGFQLKKPPLTKTDGKAVFIDPKGVRCYVNNSEIVNWVWAHGSVNKISLKFPTDEELAAFLNRRCPSFDTRSLLENLPIP